MKLKTENKQDFLHQSSFIECCIQSPEKTFFTLEKINTPPSYLSGREILLKTKVIGSLLQKKLKPRGKALLVFPQGLEYIYSLTACLYSNTTAIPIPVAGSLQDNRIIDKIKRILKDSGAQCIITQENIKKYFLKDDCFKNTTIVDVMSLSFTKNMRTEPIDRSPDDICLLLYTSGSTSQPKGVMISYKNLLWQAYNGAKQWKIDSNSCVVSWMPQFHNFGLNFNILAPLLTGASSVIMISPDFIQNPLHWFQTIQSYSGTHTAAPNFAFDYCHSSIILPESNTLSLNNLKAIICGGEPVNKDTIRNFFKKFKSLGIKENIFCPHYGLSEMGSVTTKIPGNPLRIISLELASLRNRKLKRMKGNKNNKYIVSCGEIDKSVKIKIINSETQKPAAPDEIGEIWIHSPSVGAGYLNQKELTDKVFCAIPAQNGHRADEESFLRTGDLGFIDDNHLFIVGREKEVIIIHGKNHHPVDIEWTLQKNMPALTLPIAVFSCEIDSTEKVIVVKEIDERIQKKEYEEIARNMCMVVSETHELELYAINLIKKGSIPKTGSGKIQRKKCRQAFINNELPVLYDSRYSFKQDMTESSHNKPTSHVINIVNTLKKDIFESELGIDAGKVRKATTLSELGLNSIQYVRISKRIEDIFNILFAPVMLFKYRRLEDLAKYLETQIVKTPLHVQTISENTMKISIPENNETDIAIIGMSCHFPGNATNPLSFWNNLCEQKDCITSISHSRPQLISNDRLYYGELLDTFPHWGGFIEDIELFDAGFFNISPLEAESMDPQQRKLLQLTWNVIEASGYNPDRLTGGNTGLFFGVHNNDYAELVARKPELMTVYGAYLDSGLHMSMLTNRISRWFDFHGPSEVINTACSSSLVAIHHAVESIYQGDCGVAIAGGINVILSSRIYLASNKAGMLAKDGRCKSFDSRADGFVRAEGFGAIMLKPYTQAIKDRDTIYGIIKKVVVNHDGQSNSLRAPNLVAQKKLIMSAYDKSAIPPKTISYIETHGTGTSLGDPIEIQALEEAFREIDPDLPIGYCGIGTVKTNIGHTESAAGIAGLIKVLLSMKYRQLPGILHFQKANPYIDISNSPFYIVKENRPWDRIKDSTGKEIPLRAGISSFGFGGVNAHLILEEHIPSHKNITKPLLLHDTTSQIIPFSGKTKKALDDYVRIFLDFLKQIGDKPDPYFRGIDLPEIAYTLQTGRAAMDVRAGFITTNIPELIHALEEYLSGKGTIENYWQGSIITNKNMTNLFDDDDDTDDLIQKWIKKGKNNKIIQFWVNGGKVNWNLFYKKTKPNLISLPTYPFRGERYWIIGTDGKNSLMTHQHASILHPLVHENISDLTVQKYSSRFTGDEFFLSTNTIMSAPVYLEMARAAAENASGIPEGSILILEDIVWAAPLITDKEGADIQIELFPGERIGFEIYNRKIDRILCQGYAVLGKKVEISPVDITAFKDKCYKNHVSPEKCLHLLMNNGFACKPGSLGIQEIHTGDEMVAAKVSMSTALKTDDRYVLHPQLIRAALLVSYCVSEESLSQFHSFNIEKLEIHNPCMEIMWALIRINKNNDMEKTKVTTDIDICDEEGKICVRIKAYTGKIVNCSTDISDSTGTLMFIPCFVEKKLPADRRSPEYDHHLVILCEPGPDIVKGIKDNLPGAKILSLHSKHTTLANRFETYTIRLFKEIKFLLENRNLSRILVQIVICTKEEQQVFAGFSGMLHSARLENPKITGQLIEVEEIDPGITGILKECMSTPDDIIIRYKMKKRFVAGWEEWKDVGQEVCPPWKDGGVYLITGGTGGLGLLFAREIARNVKKPVLILTGRSPLDENKQANFRKLKARGAVVEYKQTNVSQKKDTAGLIIEIQNKYKTLDGIIHAAGVIRDNYIIRKSKEKIKEVLCPKVQGLVNIDNATKNLKPGIVILFSSLAGAIGNTGQAGYATANAFMDAYAIYRNTLVKAGKRHGLTLSVNWPLWKDGGMSVDDETLSMLNKRIGMHLLHTTHGIKSLYKSIATGIERVLVIEGKKDVIRKFFKTPDTSRGQTNEIPRIKVPEKLRKKTLYKLKNLFGNITKIDAEKIDIYESTETYGIDSIIITTLNRKLEEVFGEISKTLFFEYRTLNEIACYLAQKYPVESMEWTGIDKKSLNQTVSMDSNYQAVPGNVNDEYPRLISFKEQKRKSIRYTHPNIGKEEPIAIIGLSGYYPQAKNLVEFWENLKNGKDSITEIPNDRWSLKGFYEPDLEKAISQAKSYSKWGGFIAGFNEFDPLFFNISPKEALNMDPQERLFLQSCWEVIEDAGYTRNTLTRQFNGEIGVFAGITKTGFDLYGPELWKNGKDVFPHTSFSSVANRVSYLFNFKGPSMPIDTMCSSSLTAIHEACEHLRRGECQMAIAGGVNLYLHPSTYIALCANRMLSIDGKCKSFGKDGNGFVAGEGVGTIMLKPLFAAINDKDSIYGIIRGSSVNHGGKTNGYTVPNPKAQCELVRESIKKSGIKASQISYIEAHGTGTSLGDPIEITGLTHAFEKNTQKKQYCALGSVKSNIGHLEAAAGIAGITKILLQLKYKTLVPSLHAKELNPNIDFKNTPFVLQQELKEWKRPLIKENGSEKELPRIAGISSFGAGGANAHIIIEEFIPVEKNNSGIIADSHHPVIIPLSAKNKERLTEYIRRILNYLKMPQHQNLDLARIAYTLQTGREPMEERLGIIVRSSEELLKKLNQYLAGKENIEDAYKGHIKKNRETLELFRADDELQEAIKKWIEKRKYSKLVEMWVKGLEFDWNMLYPDKKLAKLSLPTYPFAKERYWIESLKDVPGNNKGVQNKLHPLLHENTSMLEEQRFTSIFTGNEFFLGDGIIKGQKILPAAAYLELARAAIVRAVDVRNQGIELENIVWTQPFVVNGQSNELSISLFTIEDNRIAFEIYGTGSEQDEEIIYSQGEGKVIDKCEEEILDIDLLIKQCAKKKVAAKECYSIIDQLGLYCDSGYKTIQELYVGWNKVLARLELPSELIVDADDYWLHSSIINGAIQALVGLMTEKHDNPGRLVALKKIEIIAPCPDKMWAVVTYSKSNYPETAIQKLDIVLCDEYGNVCVRLNRLKLQDIPITVSANNTLHRIKESVIEEPYKIQTFKEEWCEKMVCVDIHSSIEKMVCFVRDEADQSEIKSQFEKTVLIFIESGESFQKKSKYGYYINKKEKKDFIKAFEDIAKDHNTITGLLLLWSLDDINELKKHSTILNILQAIKLSHLSVEKLLLAGEYNNEIEKSYLESLIGYERSIGLVMPNTQIAVLIIKGYIDSDFRKTLKKTHIELQSEKFESVLYDRDKRYIKKISVNKLKDDQKGIVRKEGLYLITGGLGGLGFMFAKHFAKKYQAKLVLCSRSELDARKRTQIKELENTGSKVLYIQADVSDANSLKECIKAVKEKFNSKLNGVIHAAGVVNTKNIFEKEIDDFNRVLRPKITGTLALDEVLKEEQLDFMCYFSSSSAILGDFGACDYSVANRFLMAYSEYRAKTFPGKTIVINWPLWRDGGMGFDDNANTRMYLESSGQRFLETEEGLSLFEKIIIQNENQCLVLVGKEKYVKRFLRIYPEKQNTNEITKLHNKRKINKAELKRLSLEESVEWDVIDIISTLLRIKKNNLSIESNLTEFGFDSIRLAELAKSLSSYYGFEITPAIFFGYSTIEKVREYIIENHSEKIEAFYRIPDLISEEETRISYSEKTINSLRKQRSFSYKLENKRNLTSEPIAIIGMSGKFPQANTIEDMWNILENGKEAIVEIPKERWDWKKYYGDPVKEKNKTNCKWSGFIPGVKEFDPLFFEISPVEAEAMDPRQRQLLQESWKALEDAGYGAEEIKVKKIGMYVGVEDGGYHPVTASTSVTSTHNAILAARLAYFLNFTGPNMAINTACSSGLVALHQAVISLRNEECDTAIAAGVNLILNPKMYVQLAQAGMLSEDGRCYAFGKKANGLVPGEAVAVVVLKRLSQAQRDGDNIYAVIKGSGLNYDGKTNGITAPSSVAQSNLLESIYEKYKINPEHISYIVTHGTGTKLGDPVEINALHKVFKKYTNKNKYCAITSTKTNFGHSFAASGLVSLISLIEAMKHKKIPGSLNCEPENDYIKWKSTPFYLNKTLKNWEVKYGETRIGAVSSFGMSGTNAHVVVAEYKQVKKIITREYPPFQMIVLSAKSEESLTDMVQAMLDFLKSKTLCEEELLRISYTLLKGRHHFRHRVAFVIQNQEDFITSLSQYQAGEKRGNIFKSKVDRSFKGQKAPEKYGQDLIKDSHTIITNKSQYRETISALADLYCQGYELDWSLLFPEQKPTKISLPTYPFAKEQYWTDIIDAVDKHKGSLKKLHPLLHENISTLEEQQFRSNFNGQEFFLSDHIVDGQKVLPGVAYLEIARAAIEKAVNTDNQVIVLENIVWTRPFVVNRESKDLYVALSPGDEDEIIYEIFSNNTLEEEELIYSQGTGKIIGKYDEEIIDIEALKNQCNKKRIIPEECYSMFEVMGIHYGPGHRSVKRLYVGKDKVLACLEIPSQLMEDKDKYILHPSMMDGTLQAAIGLMTGNNSNPVLPFALDRLEIVSECTENMWSIVKYSDKNNHESNTQKLDIFLYDESGKICVRMYGFTSRILKRKTGVSEKANHTSTILLEPIMQEKEITITESLLYKKRIAILCEIKKPDKENPLIEYISLQSKEKEVSKKYEEYALSVFEEVKKILQSKPEGNVIIQVLLENRPETKIFKGINALLLTAHNENPKIYGQVIGVTNDQDVEKILAENAAYLMDQEIEYDKNMQRQVLTWRELETEQKEIKHPWKDNGVYLITGGLGGLGLIFAKDIGDKVKGAEIILTGRSKLTEEKQKHIHELENSGLKVEYYSVDVTDQEDVTNLIKNIQIRYERLTGIIHSAGIIKDNFIIKKSKKEFKEVLGPKVQGLINIDEATKNMDLDVIIFFSSMAGAYGNMGQSDYSCANAFMDNYAEYRNDLVKKKLRNGKTVSINWPLWQEGGMSVDHETLLMMKTKIGVDPLKTAVGISALYKCLSTNAERVVVMDGDINQIRNSLSLLQANSEFHQQDKNLRNLTEKSKNIMQEKTIDFFKSQLSSVLQLPVHKIDEYTPMEKYGIDSILVLKLTGQLEKEFGLLSKTLFFEYHTIRELADYFIEFHSVTLQRVLGINEKEESSASVIVKYPKLNSPGKSSKRRKRFLNMCSKSYEMETFNKNMEIAIIGLAGRYPKAGNINEFWNILKTGKDCITEIPEERWDHSLYYDEDKSKIGKTYSKWGGFIDGVYLFDPLFFKISPRDAALIDPQERLFLQCAYETIEDAGYTRESLGLSHPLGPGGNVGVFVGVMYEEYQLYGAQETIQGRTPALQGSPASIANRVSYFCNFNGPSMAVDTMCSSSLTTIHLACQSLNRDECKLAIAGGINISIHPNKYLMLAQENFVSSKGRCESFGQGGDGYVPGEGVGAVLLKPLAQAIKDGDHIYGVIAGTAVNHGGKTNGYTVPNPNAQAAVIKKAFEVAGVNPGSVSYIEAHGTGTSLGDPIEIAGLAKVFNQERKGNNICVIGSVKSNIGHCESAAGIAGVTKVLLQLKYRKLLPSLHSDILNPHIDFQKTPFVIQQKLAEWKITDDSGNNKQNGHSRIAGISSFGAGGANAHIVIKEYIPDTSMHHIAQYMSKIPIIILLSAKNVDKLREQANRLLSHISEHRYTNENLINIAYTLQTGREAMEERMAIMVQSIDELKAKLHAYLSGENNIAGLYLGQIKDNKETMNIISDEDMNTTIETWIAKGKYIKLVTLWVKGMKIDWNKLYGKNKPHRISLPTYPFAKESYFALKPGDRNVMQEDEKQKKRQLVFLKKDWDLCPLSHLKKRNLRVIILSTPETLNLVNELSKYFIECRIVNANNHGNLLKNQKIIWENFDGLIDLTGLEKIKKDSIEWIEVLIQFIRQVNDKDLMLLCVTKGLESYLNNSVTISGASRVGLYRMLQSEYSKIKSRHIDVEPSIKNNECATLIVNEFFTESDEHEICYRNGKRYKPVLTEKEIRENRNLSFPEDHVLFITGGTRGLGLLCAHYFVKNYKIKYLVLTGREKLPERNLWHTFNNQNNPIAHKIRNIKALESEGVQVEVLSLPLINSQMVKKAFEHIKKTIGPIGGIIHCAGSGDFENPAFIRKTIEGIQKVIDPKIIGTRILYENSKNNPLQFFILFSSVSSVIPSLATGQSIYAMANAYMDYFAQAQKDTCPLISIQWPNWKETGMGHVKNNTYKQSGLLSLSDQEGLYILENILTNQFGPVILPAMVDPVLWEPDRLLQRSPANSNNKPELLYQSDQFPYVKKGNTSFNSIQSWIIKIISEELRIEVSKLDVDIPLQDYGVDSILFAQVVQRINKKIDHNLDPSVIFEYPTIKSFSEWLSENYSEKIAYSFELQENIKNVESIKKLHNNSSTSENKIHHSNQSEKTDIHDSTSTDIAVIGISCRFPGADNPDEYWDMLIHGKSAIKKVSAQRWGYQNPYFAGLLDNITHFDPDFFMISKNDAVAMDPQALHLLEVCYYLWYHAGYSHLDIKRSNIGVFIGARSRHIPDNSVLKNTDNPIIATGQNYLAANISHFFDLKGPCIVLDTACSSALVGMKLAVNAMQNNEIDSAVVGGVSLLDSDGIHKMFQQRNILNPGSHYHIFDKRANGIIIGEGAGLAWLKPLDKALMDGDQVYAVIKSIAINNDGRTAGPASPNIQAQKDVLQAALQKSGKKPGDIEYIEVNGSGSEVTDLIELKAIQSVYGSEELQSCSLGSMKPNIGHLLCAEGIAGFIKVVLMLYNNQNVPFLSGEQAIDHFNIKSSSFCFCREKKPWKNEIPVAAINCFADGGTNAHVIIESYNKSNESDSVRKPLIPPQLKKYDIYSNKLSIGPNQIGNKVDIEIISNSKHQRVNKISKKFRKKNINNNTFWNQNVKEL